MRMRSYNNGGRTVAAINAKADRMEVSPRKAQGMKNGGTAHSDAAMDKKAIGKAIKEHADKPASKAHRGLRNGGGCK